jgi:hypothetical protein
MNQENPIGSFPVSAVVLTTMLWAAQKSHNASTSSGSLDLMDNFTESGDAFGADPSADLGAD